MLSVLIGGYVGVLWERWSQESCVTPRKRAAPGFRIPLYTLNPVPSIFTALNAFIATGAGLAPRFFA